MSTQVTCPPLKMIAYHAIAGLALAIPVYIAIVSRSLSNGLNFLMIEALFALPMFASWLRRQKTQAARKGGSLLIAGWTLFIAFNVLLVVERLYLVNANTYPEWLAGRRTVAQDAPCPDGGLAEIFNKKNGELMRCGFTWFEGETFFIDNEGATSESTLSAKERAE